MQEVDLQNLLLCQEPHHSRQRIRSQTFDSGALRDPEVAPDCRAYKVLWSEVEAVAPSISNAM